ncbi:MAG: Mur ligase family protein, partial [Erysipelotrichaceae bacterium]|nr:Mur ligase family protein [Erysipelotrichaceae bacterium]
MEFRNKKILVIGLARSGLAAIRLLHEIGVTDITLTEQKEVKEREWLESIGVTILPQSDEVFSRPYDIVIKNPGVPPISPFIRRFKDRGVPVITEIELAVQTAKPQHYIGITGTNGKTTTTTLVYEMLKKAFGDKAHVGGNIGIPLCEVVLENNLLNEEGHYISLELSNMQLIDTVDL